MTSLRSCLARAPVVVLVLLTFWSWSGVARADPHTESAAKEALTKAQGDYAAGTYANAALALKKALTACGTNRCGAPLRAVLLRDYGVMQFRTGDRTGAGKSFDDALALDSSILLDPNYDAWDVGSAFEDSRAAAGLPAGTVSTKPPPGGGPPPPPPPPAPSATAAAPATPTADVAANDAATPQEQPTGGYFSHDPAPEQRENTPLPVYAEYTGRSRLARVILHYKGAQMRDWQRVELHREGTGYSAVLPCGDVTRGTMRYWIQGFDAAGTSVGASGDPNHPYFVPIRDHITGEPPHLPGKEPPRSCEDTDCPPGIAGCAAGKKAEPGEAGETAAPSDLGVTQAPATQSSDEWEGYSHVWVGGSFGVEFLALPSANDVCRVSGSGAPVNSAHYLCFGFDPLLGANANYPSAATGMSENGDINYGGTAPGGFTFGDIRVLFAFDYALSANALAGFRFGGVFNSYPGRGAGFPSRLHWELRGTYLFGHAPLLHRGFAPLLVAGVGLSEFDGRTATHDLTINGLPPTGPLAPQSEDVWLSNGPYFVMAGLGIRYQWTRHLALTGDVRLNVAFGLNGVLPTFGPEMAVQVGF